MNKPLHVKSSIDEIIIIDSRHLSKISYGHVKDKDRWEMHFTKIGSDDYAYCCLLVKGEQEAKDLLALITKELGGSTVEIKPASIVTGGEWVSKEYVRVKGDCHNPQQEKPKIKNDYIVVPLGTFSDPDFQLKEDIKVKILKEKTIYRINEDERGNGIYIEIPAGTLIQKFKFNK